MAPSIDDLQDLRDGAGGRRRVDPGAGQNWAFRWFCLGGSSRVTSRWRTWRSKVPQPTSFPRKRDWVGRMPNWTFAWRMARRASRGLRRVIHLAFKGALNKIKMDPRLRGDDDFLW